jgi:hypothetical protein
MSNKGEKQMRIAYVGEDTISQGQRYVHHAWAYGKRSDEQPLDRVELESASDESRQAAVQLADRLIAQGFTHVCLANPSDSNTFDESDLDIHAWRKVLMECAK